jgi:hypothetical protein
MIKVCLAVGVVKWSVVRAVEIKLRELGIPRDAVYFRLQPYAQLASFAFEDTGEIMSR